MEPITSCLASPRASCDASATCDSTLSSRDCLHAPIPAWREGVNYERVHCCLRCCLSGWITALGLHANAEHWRKNSVNFWVHQGAGGQRKANAAPPRAMPLDSVLNVRFSIGRFAHFLAIEKRDLLGLNESTPRTSLRGPQYRVPRAHGHKAAHRANGSLVVLNGWEHSHLTLSRIAATLPAGPLALYYGDDESWSASKLLGFRDALGGPSRLARHFAMNLDASAAALPHVSQVPIGLNGFSVDLPEILGSAEGRALQPATAHRQRRLLCCCQRAWPQRERAFAALRAAGHTHCNLTARKPYNELFRLYLRHRFVAAVHGHGATDFREWEILAAGAVPVVQHFDAHDALYEGLPIVRVRDWSSVTQAFLDAEWERLQAEARAGRINWQKVYFPFWFGRYTAHMRPGV